MIIRFITVVAFFAAAAPTVSAFAFPPSVSTSASIGNARIRSQMTPAIATFISPSSPECSIRSSSGSSSLSALPFSAGSGMMMNSFVVKSVARKLIVALVSAFALLSFRKIFQPNSLIKGDESTTDADLPEVAPSCPFIGNQILVGSRQFGTGYFYHKMSAILNHPRMWVYSFMGTPGMVVSGGQRVKSILNKEFAADGVKNYVQPNGVLNEHNLLAESDKKKHSLLRRLVGSAMTPSRVTASMPALQEAAEKQVQKMVNSNKDNGHNNDIYTMETVCNDYTLDVAWQQILGLDLKEDDIPEFTKAVDTWISGFTSVRVNMNIDAQRAPCFKAKKYLQALIMEKIEYLEKNGPDGSTVSGMVFAVDDNAEVEGGGTGRKLTKEEVVENSLLLILAGSETSASTLTNAMLCIGLNKETWKNVVEEQKKVVSKYGNEQGKVEFTTKMLDRECPYLDAVVRETMRIKPISQGAPRTTKKTMKVDGFQIPKGWGINWSVLLTHELDPVTYKEDGSHMDVRTGFVPERWLEDTTKPTTDFIPMGAGPRYCLGSTLAYAEMKVFLAVLAQNVNDFQLAEGQKEKDVLWKRLSIIPRPLNGVPITIQPSTVVSESIKIEQEVSRQIKNKIPTISVTDLPNKKTITKQENNEVDLVLS